VNAAPLATALLGGVAALDAEPVAQTLFSQPLVTATVLGFVWGDWATAFEVGIVLQVLAASTLPVGSRTPEDYATGGVVGVGLALALANHEAFTIAKQGCAMLGVLVGMVVATAGIPLLKWKRRTNEGLARWCEEAVRAGDAGAPARAQGAAIVLSFALGVTYTALCLGVGIVLLDRVAAQESLRLARAWTLARPLWLGLGLAQVLSAFLQRRLTRGVAFGAALVATWMFLMIGGH
jgi:mannose/fructose/N-acetylgalactosamine-specific phosphotransferase system component IIC